MALFCRQCLAFETQTFLSLGVLLFDMEQSYPSTFTEWLNSDNNYSAKIIARQVELWLFTKDKTVLLHHASSVSGTDCFHDFDRPVVSSALSDQGKIA